MIIINRKLRKLFLFHEKTKDKKIVHRSIAGGTEKHDDAGAGKRGRILLNLKKTKFKL